MILCLYMRNAADSGKAGYHLLGLGFISPHFFSPLKALTFFDSKQPASSIFPRFQLFRLFIWKHPCLQCLTFAVIVSLGRRKCKISHRIISETMPGHWTTDGKWETNYLIVLTHLPFVIYSSLEKNPEITLLIILRLQSKKNVPKLEILSVVWCI
jgi:hypothetical protein